MKIDPNLKNVMASVVSRVNNLSKKFDAFTLMSNRNPHQDQDSLMNVAIEPSVMCVICDSSEHMMECCPNLSVIKAEHANAINAYTPFRRPTLHSFSQTYHSDNRFHPSFSYRQSDLFNNTVVVLLVFKGTFQGNVLLNTLGQTKLWFFNNHMVLFNSPTTI